MFSHYYGRAKDRSLTDSFNRGQNIVDKSKGPGEIANVLHETFQDAKRGLKRTFGPSRKRRYDAPPVPPRSRPQKPTTDQSNTKSMQMEKDHSVLADLLKSPLLSGHFNDLDDMDDLFESLDAQELRIIIDSNDPKVLIQVKQKVQDDMRESAKQLAMDD